MNCQDKVFLDTASEKHFMVMHIAIVYLNLKKPEDLGGSLIPHYLAQVTSLLLVSIPSCVTLKGTLNMS